VFGVVVLPNRSVEGHAAFALVTQRSANAVRECGGPHRPFNSPIVGGWGECAKDKVRGKFRIESHADDGGALDCGEPSPLWAAVVLGADEIVAAFFHDNLHGGLFVVQGTVSNSMNHASSDSASTPGGYNCTAGNSSPGVSAFPGS